MVEEDDVCNLSAHAVHTSPVFSFFDPSIYEITAKIFLQNLNPLRTSTNMLADNGHISILKLLTTGLTVSGYSAFTPYK